MQIIQLQTTLPKEKYSTEELLQGFPCDLPKGVRQNILNLGVSSRYLINHVSSVEIDEAMNEDKLSDLCSDACLKAVEKASLTIKDINYLIATYDANPFLSPGLSYLLIPRLGLSSHIKHINAQGVASTAFPKALELAENYLTAHPQDHVLMCISGLSSYWFQNQIREIESVMEIDQVNQITDKAKKRLELQKWVATMQYFLFGDGVAAAVVAKKNEGLTIKKIVEVTNLREKDYLAGYSKLEALNEPFKFGFYSHLDRDIPKLGSEYTALALKSLLGEKTESTIRKAKKCVVHTGSEKILCLLAEYHNIEPRKLEESHSVLREYGNLAGASLPFILQRVIANNRLSKNDFILMVGYGWGFSAAACLLEQA